MYANLSTWLIIHTWRRLPKSSQWRASMGKVILFHIEFIIKFWLNSDNYLKLFFIYWGELYRYVGWGLSNYKSCSFENVKTFALNVRKIFIWTSSYIDQYICTYYSKNYVLKNFVYQSTSNSLIHLLILFIKCILFQILMYPKMEMQYLFAKYLLKEFIIYILTVKKNSWPLSCD